MESSAVLDDVAEDHSQKDATVSPNRSTKGSDEQKTLDQIDDTEDIPGNVLQGSVDQKNEAAGNGSDDGREVHNLFGEDEDKSGTGSSSNVERELPKEQDVEMSVNSHDDGESEVVDQGVEINSNEPVEQASDVLEHQNGVSEDKMDTSAQSVSSEDHKEIDNEAQERIDGDIEMGGMKEEVDDSTDKAGDLSENQGIAEDASITPHAEENGNSEDSSVEQLSDQIEGRSQAPLQLQKEEDQNNEDDEENVVKEMARSDSQENENKNGNKQSDLSSQNLAIPQSHEIVIPSYSKWFNLTKIHSIERQSLPEFFTNRIPSKTPQVYVKCRNYMVNSYRLNPNEYFSVTTARRNVCGDSAAIFRVHKFLMKWGVINYQVDASMLPKNVEPPFTGEYSTKHDAPRGLFPFESYKPSVQLPDMAKLKKMMDTNDSNSTLHKYMKERKRKLSDEADISGETADATNNMHQEVDNVTVQSDVSPKEWTNGVKRPKVLQESNIDDGWGKEELQKLLKGIQEHGSEWYTIAKEVGTKSPEQCILKFLQLPIEDRFLHQNTKSSDLGPLKYAPHLPFSKSENPVMSTIAFLVGLVDPKNVQEMTNRALRNVKESKTEVLDKVAAKKEVLEKFAAKIEEPKQENINSEEPKDEAASEDSSAIKESKIEPVKEDISNTEEPKDVSLDQKSGSAATIEESEAVEESNADTEKEDTATTEERKDENDDAGTVAAEEPQIVSSSDTTTSEESKKEPVNEDTPTMEESEKKSVSEDTISAGEPKQESDIENISAIQEPKKELTKNGIAAVKEPKEEVTKANIATTEELEKEAINEDTAKDGSEIALASLGVRSHVFATSEERQMNMISNQLVNVQLQKIETKLKLLGKIEESLELEKKSLQRQQEDVLVQRLALTKHSHLVYEKFEDSLRTLSNPGEEKNKLTNQVAELKELLHNPPKLSIGAAFNAPSMNSSSNSSLEPSGAAKSENGVKPVSIDAPQFYRYWSA